MTAEQSAIKHAYRSPFHFRPIHSDGALGAVERTPIAITHEDRQRIANAIPEGRRFRVASIEEIDRKREGRG